MANHELAAAINQAAALWAAIPDTSLSVKLAAELHLRDLLKIQMERANRRPS